MSQFASAKPFPGEGQYGPTGYGTNYAEPPAWVSAATCVLGSLLPCALVMLYWANKVKCDRVISVTLWSVFAAYLIAIWWMVSSGALRRNADD